jgi:Zn-dependent metalloprotease
MTPHRARRRSLLLPLAALAGITLALLYSGGEAAAQPADPPARARQHLRDNAAALGLRPDTSDLRLADVRESPAGEHVRYQQTIDGVPVFGAYVTVNLPRTAAIDPSVTSRYAAGPAAPATRSRLTPADASAAALAALDVGPADLRAVPSVELLYFPDGDGYALAWQVTVPTFDPPASWLVVLDAAGGETLMKRDLLARDSGQVFEPNPPTSSGGAIPPPTDCDSAANEALLAGEYATVALQGIAPTQNRLIGEYVDVTAPGLGPGYKPPGLANEPSHEWVYSCDDDRFEEVMAYYHIDSVQRNIQALGFSGTAAILDEAVPVFPHFYSGCNAFYDPVSRGIFFGDSDATSCSPFHADAAEDADVIVHEYGHALQDNQIPGYAYGPFPEAGQALSMGEGFADFLAAATFGDPCMSEWFTVNRTACDGGAAPGLRWLDNANVYPADYLACPNINANGLPGDGAETEEPHCGGLLWGGALWDVVQALGEDQAARDLTLRLVLTAHFFLDPLATFDEAAAAVCAADEVLYAGAHVATISAAFAARGISSGDCAPDDFAYAYLRILHSFSGDLDVNLKVGSDVDAPACSLVVQDGPVSGSGSLVGYTTIEDCQSFLPPSAGQPWWLEVQDVAAQDIGTIENFEVSLAGSLRCVAGDLPVLIPDATDGPGPNDIPGPKVYAMVDCTNQVEPCAGDSDADGAGQCLDNCPDTANGPAQAGQPGVGDQTNTDQDLAVAGAGMGLGEPPPPLPGDEAGDACDDDDDSDGFSDAVELFAGSNPFDNCLGPPGSGGNAWPPDFNADALINITDLLVLKPAFNSSAPDPAYQARFDLYDQNGTINLFDVLAVKPFYNMRCS